MCWQTTSPHVYSEGKTKNRFPLLWEERESEQGAAGLGLLRPALGASVSPSKSNIATALGRTGFVRQALPEPALAWPRWIYSGFLTLAWVILFLLRVQIFFSSFSSFFLFSLFLSFFLFSPLSFFFPSFFLSFFFPSFFFLERYVEMAKSSTLGLEMASVQAFCALRLRCCAGSDPKAGQRRVLCPSGERKGEQG